MRGPCGEVRLSRIRDVGDVARYLPDAECDRRDMTYEGDRTDLRPIRNLPGKGSDNPHVHHREEIGIGDTREMRDGLMESLVTEHDVDVWVQCREGESLDDEPVVMYGKRPLIRRGQGFIRLAV